MFRSIVIASALLVPGLSFADSIEYKTALRAELEPTRPGAFLDGQLELDGSLGLIKLILQPKMPECAEGMGCIQMMPSTQEIMLEGAEATVDHCGIVTIKAMEDARPWDGPLSVITVRDNQKNTCPTFAPLKAIEVKYESKYYNRFEAAEISEETNFSSDKVTIVDDSAVTPGPIDYQAVIRAHFNSNNSTRYNSGSIFMDGRKGILEITLQEKMPPCAKGKACAMVMPAPFTTALEGATSTIDHCGIVTTSAMQDLRPVDGAMTKITIRHNQNNTCPTFRELKAVEIVFERTYYGRMAGKSVYEIDSFETDTVAFIKPRD